MWILKHKKSILVLAKGNLFLLFAGIIFSVFACYLAALAIEMTALWSFWWVCLLSYLMLVPYALRLFNRAAYFAVLDCENRTLIKGNFFFKSSGRVVPFDQILRIHTIDLLWGESEQVLELDLVSKERVLLMDCGISDVKNTERMSYILYRAIFEGEKRIDVLLQS